MPSSSRRPRPPGPSLADLGPVLAAAGWALRREPGAVGGPSRATPPGRRARSRCSRCPRTRGAGGTRRAPARARRGARAPRRGARRRGGGRVVARGPPRPRRRAAARRARRRARAAPRGEAVTVLVPVAQALTALHREGRSHGRLDATSVVVTSGGRVVLRPPRAPHDGLDRGRRPRPRPHGPRPRPSARDEPPRARRAARRRRGARPRRAARGARCRAPRRAGRSSRRGDVRRTLLRRRRAATDRHAGRRPPRRGRPGGPAQAPSVVPRRRVAGDEVAAPPGRRGRERPAASRSDRGAERRCPASGVGRGPVRTPAPDRRRLWTGRTAVLVGCAGLVAAVVVALAVVTPWPSPARDDGPATTRTASAEDPVTDPTLDRADPLGAARTLTGRRLELLTDGSGTYPRWWSPVRPRRRATPSCSPRSPAWTWSGRGPRSATPGTPSPDAARRRCRRGRRGRDGGGGLRDRCPQPAHRVGRGPGARHAADHGRPGAALDRRGVARRRSTVTLPESPADPPAGPSSSVRGPGALGPPEG